MLKLVCWISFLGALILPLSAQAQSSPSIDEKISYIFEVSDAQKSFDVGFNAIKPLLLSRIQKSSNKITPELANHIAGIIEEEALQIKPSIMIFIKDYYKRQFAVEEISALYDFYRTPVGLRLASKMNTVMASLFPEMQTFVSRQLAPRIKTRLSADTKLRDAFKP
jgi:hypothetical protein